MKPYFSDCFDDGFTKFYFPEILNLNYDVIVTAPIMF